MLNRIITNSTKNTNAVKFFSKTVSAKTNVAILGAAGGIGQPLSMQLKLQNPKIPINKLNLFDIVNTPGVAADISHIPSQVKVEGFVGTEQLSDALKGMDIVVIPAGVPRKPGMTRDDLFNTNASIVKSLADACADNCPDAKLLIISNPVNSTVPIVAQALKNKGVYNKNNVFGVTTLDCLRARTFFAEVTGLNPETLNIPVVGGHAGTTILPLLSQNSANKQLDEKTVKELTHRIQFGGDEVVQAKDGAGSATLSMAYAGALFTTQMVHALQGNEIVSCTFVESDVTDAPFFASKVTLNKNGVGVVHNVGDISNFEQETLDALIPQLIKSYEKGVDFVNKN